jgi:hypothetical protein
LVVATARGRTDYVPPAISGIVVRKCVVITEVSPDALDLDNITFHVSSSELISTINPETASSSASKLPTTTQKSA